MLKMQKMMIREMRWFNSRQTGASLLERLGIIERVCE